MSLSDSFYVCVCVCVCVCVMIVAASSVTVTTAGHFTFGGQREVKALPSGWFAVTLGAALRVALTEAKAICFRHILDPRRLHGCPWNTNLLISPPISCHCVIISARHDILTFHYQISRRCFGVFFSDGLKPVGSNDSILAAAARQTQQPLNLLLSFTVCTSSEKR